MDLNNFEIRFSSEQECAEIQQLLLDRGIIWYSGHKSVKLTERKSIQVQNGKMCTTSYKLPEVSINELVRFLAPTVAPTLSELSDDTIRRLNTLDTLV